MTNNEMPEMLPCPFCGGEADFDTYDHIQSGTVYKAGCIDCDYGIGSWRFGETAKLDTAKTWNTRANVQPAASVPQEVLQLVADALDTAFYTSRTYSGSLQHGKVESDFYRICCDAKEALTALSPYLKTNAEVQK